MLVTEIFTQTLAFLQGISRFELAFECEFRVKIEI